LDVAVNVLVVNGVAVVHWGAFSFTTRLAVHENAWHHVSCSWRAIDGRFQVCVGPAGQTIGCEARHGVMLSGVSGVYGVVQVGKPLMYRDTVDIALVGSVDSVRVWNIARSADDIVEYINLPLPNGAPGLVMDLDFDNSAVREGEAAQATFTQYPCGSADQGEDSNTTYLPVEMGSSDGCTRTKFKKGRIGFKTTTSTTTTTTGTTTSKTTTTITNTTTTTTTYHVTETTTTTVTDGSGSGDGVSKDDDGDANATNATNATGITTVPPSTTEGSDSDHPRITGTGGEPVGEHGGQDADGEQAQGGEQAQAHAQDGGLAQDGGGQAQSQGQTGSQGTGGQGDQGGQAQAQDGAQAQGQGSQSQAQAQAQAQGGQSQDGGQAQAQAQAQGGQSQDGGQAQAQAQGGQSQDGGQAQAQAQGGQSQDGSQAQAQAQGGSQGGDGAQDGGQGQPQGSQNGGQGANQGSEPESPGGGQGGYWYGPPKKPVIVGSTAPLEYPKDVAKCAFASSALRAEANNTCASWFEEGELVDECEIMGPETFAFFQEACLCDIASANDVEQYRVSLCALTLMCIDVGITDLETLFDAHCFEFISTTTTTATSTTTTTQDFGASGTGLEGRRRWVWELLLCALVCMIILVIWYLVIWLLDYYTYKEEEIIVKSKEPLVLPKDGYLASASSPFAEVTDAERGSIPAFAMELEPITNPLYGKAKLGKKDKKKAKRASSIDGNYQDGKDNSFIDLGMFDVDGSWDPVNDAGNQEVVSDKEDPHKILLAELADQPWMKITLDVSDVDVTFSLDGKIIRTNRLPEPVEDIPGDGSLLVGARHPKEHRFTGEIKALHFTESVKEPATPDDAPGFGGRPPGPGSTLKKVPVNLLAIGDDARRVVKPGSEKTSKLFDGGFHTSLNIPTQLHPGLKEYGCPTCFKIEATIKQKVGTSGYIVAKTDSAGLSRYWALGVVTTETGMSFQFYYRPKGSVRGHRITLANHGMFNDATMDPDHVIVGQLNDQEDMSAAERRAATAADAIGAKSAMDKFVKLEAEAKNVPEVADRDSVQAPQRRKSSKIMQKMKAMGAGATESGLEVVGEEEEVDDAKRAAQMKKELSRLETREIELNAVLAASTTLRNSATEAERVAGSKDAEVRKLQAELKQAEVRASRAAAKRDEVMAAAQEAAAAEQGKAMVELLKPSSRPANLGKATHLSISPGVQPVTPPDVGGADEGDASIEEMLAMLSLFPDLN